MRTEVVAEMGEQGMASGWSVMMLSEGVGEKAEPRMVRMVPPEWGPTDGAYEVMMGVKVTLTSGEEEGGTIAGMALTVRDGV